MKMSVTRCCSVLVLSCLLAACLPGKKQEEKVIAQAQQATQEVAAERMAADMSNAAQNLMAMINDKKPVTSLNSPELQTLPCSDGSVVAFVKQTNTRKTLPQNLANQMGDILKAKFSAKAVGSTELVEKCQAGAGDIENIAVNSPVLMLSNTAADRSQSQDDPDIISVDVSACPPVPGKTVTGIIVRKTKKDGTQLPAEDHCGQFDNNNDKVTLSTNTMPNWKQQLAGVVGATVPYDCIVKLDANGNKDPNGKCTNVKASEMGDLTQCTDSNQADQYVLNPSENDPLVTDPNPVSCGKDWVGQRVGRVRNKECKLMHDGQLQGTAKLYNVTIVAAKCSRDNVINIPAQCPAGSGKFYAGYKHVDMVDPVVLATSGSSGSTIAPANYQLDQAERDQIQSLTKSTNVYIPTVDNIGSIQDKDAFATALVNNMNLGSHVSGLVPANINKCNIYGNSCVTQQQSVDHVAILLDRSASMGSKDDAQLLRVSPSLGEGYACKAGLSNIFTTDQSKDACAAAKDFVKQNPYQASPNSIDPTVASFVMTPWGGGKTPDANSLALYQKMEDALIDKTYYKPYLQFALATGWDCSGRQQAGSAVKQPFPDDMFGTCSGAQSCTTCPGSCQPTEIQDLSSTPAIPRVDAASLVLQQIARMNLRPNTKITLGMFLNDDGKITSTIYCPPDRQNNGACDLKLERDSLVALLAKSDDIKHYVKPVSQDVIIPTEPPKQPVISIVPDVRSWSGFMTESSSNFTAPTNQIITGRQHSGDENGQTRYQYATLKAVDSNGQPVPGTITVEDYRWSGDIKESSATWFYSSPRVIVGRRHSGDENDPTAYETAQVKFNGTPVQITGNVNSPRVVESDRNKTCNKMTTFDHMACTGNQSGIAYTTPDNMVMVGRYHESDENGDTVYQAGLMTAPCSGNGDQQITVPGDWKNFRDEAAAGTFDKAGDYEYKDCQSFPRARSVVNPAQYDKDWVAQIFNVQFFNNFGSDVSIPGSTIANGGTTYHYISTIAYLPQTITFNGVHPWDQSDPIPSNFITDDSRGGGKTYRTDVNVTFCASRRLKVGSTQTIAACQQICDVHECASLPAVTASDDWESWSNADAKGTANKSGDYEYSSCATINKVECYDNGNGNGSYPQQNLSLLDRLNPVSPAYAVFAPIQDPGDGSTCTYNPRPTSVWVTNEDANTYTYCTMRRLRQDWVTADQAKADGTFNESTLPNGTQNTGDYSFDQCTQVSDCGMEGGECAYVNGDPNTPECRGYQACLSYNAAPTNAWNIGSQVTGSSSYGDTVATTYCTSRLKKPNASSDNANLAACLDKCHGKTLVENDVRTCQTSKNLFTGQTATNCATIKMPTMLDYRPANYTGKSITQRITNFIPSSATESGAMEAASTLGWGTEYGGDTPLFATLDKLLASSDMKPDLDAQKPMRVVVLTDGIDTGDGSSTIKSLCDDSVGASFLSKLKAADPNAQAMFISLNDSSKVNAVCATAVPGSSFLYSNEINSRMDKVTTFLAPATQSFDGSTSNTSAVTDATKFCTDNFGADSVYQDANVAITTGDTGTGLLQRPSICRAFEVVQ